MTILEGMEQYLSYIRASQSRGTARTYATGLRHFQRYLRALSRPPETTDIQTLDLPVATGFIPWLYEYLLENVAEGHPEKVSEATKANYYTAVSRLFEYLIVEAQCLSMTMQEYDTLRKAFARAVKTRNRSELPPDKLPSQEIVAALLAEARQPLDLQPELPPGEARRKELAHLRNIAIIEALRSSGMRVGELVRLERGHLLHEARGALVKYAKGKKDREVLFSDQAWNAIQAYLKARQDAGYTRALARLPLFARHDRGAGSRVLFLSTRSVQNILIELASRAELLERFHLTPHTLRHFFATEFLSETGDLALTQYALGHASPTTTRIYAQTKREDYRRAHREVFGTEGRENNPEPGELGA